MQKDVLSEIKWVEIKRSEIRRFVNLEGSTFVPLNLSVNATGYLHTQTDKRKRWSKDLVHACFNCKMVMSCRITGGNKIGSDCAAGCSFFDYPLQPKKSTACCLHAQFQSQQFPIQDRKKCGTLERVRFYVRGRSCHFCKKDVFFESHLFATRRSHLIKTKMKFSLIVLVELLLVRSTFRFRRGVFHRTLKMYMPHWKLMRLFSWVRSNVAL